MAILAHEGEIVTWPTQEERSQISRRIREASGFPSCVGFVDGTLFPFETRPLMCGQDWYSRRGKYGTAGLLVCDDYTRIHYLYVGWAGCTHDQRVFDNSALELRPDELFSPSQYLLADSGYSPRSHVVPAFKRPPRQGLSAAENAFNSRLSSIRVRVEHCIGMLKARFSSLRGSRLLIGNERSLHRCVYWIRACATLHNLLLDDPVDDEWMGTDDESDDEDRREQVEAEYGEVQSTQDEGKRKRRHLMEVVLAADNGA